MHTMRERLESLTSDLQLHALHQLAHPIQQASPQLKHNLHNVCKSAFSAPASKTTKSWVASMQTV